MAINKDIIKLIGVTTLNSFRVLFLPLVYAYGLLMYLLRINATMLDEVEYYVDTIMVQVLRND